MKKISLESAEKQLSIAFSQIRLAIRDIKTVSKVIGLNDRIVSFSDNDNGVVELPLSQAIEQIEIMLDMKQEEKLPDIP